MKHLYQKQQYHLPGKTYWRARRRLSYHQSVSGPDLPGPKLLVVPQQRVPAEQKVPATSQTLQQWLQTGGKVDTAVFYNVEIFVEMV